MAPYILELFGNYVSKHEFTSLDAALNWVRTTFYEPLRLHAVKRPLDPDDDRILIWEQMPDGSRTLVWHFSGSMWEQDARDVADNSVEQGKLPGHDKPLVEDIMDQS